MKAAFKFKNSGLGRTILAPMSASLMMSAWLNGADARKDVIPCGGSDSMINLLQAWAEAYAKVDPKASVEISNGPGPSLQGLFTRTADVIGSNGLVQPEKIEKARGNTGKELKRVDVGYDALAIYVHKDNPLTEITLDQLAQIYTRGAQITNWSQLGVAIPRASSDSIACISRHNYSSSHSFFRKRVLNKNDFKAECRDMHSSKEVVEFVGKTSTAIGYAPAGLETPMVKVLKITAKSGKTALAPTVEHIRSQQYPLVCSLHLYTLDEPRAAVKRFVDWTLSDAGQKVVEETGFVPILKATVRQLRSRP